LKKDEDGLKVRCKIEYQSDTDNNFFGKTVTSGEMVLRTAHITSFAASDVGPINGESITLTCIAIGENKPKFSFKFAGTTIIDTSVFEEVSAVEENESGTTYTAKYVLKTKSPTYLNNGYTITCEVSHSGFSDYNLK
jgi:hypothetical protein